MNWSAIGVILVGAGLIANVAVAIFGRPNSTGALYDTIAKLNISIQKLNDSLDNALKALDTLEKQFAKQWDRIDEHSVLISDMDKEIGLIKARCEWVQARKQEKQNAE